MLKCDIFTIADWVLSYRWLENKAHIIISMLAHTCVVTQNVDAQRVGRTQSVLGWGTQIWNWESNHNEGGIISTPHPKKKKSFKNLSSQLLTVPVNAWICNLNATVIQQANVFQLLLSRQQQVFRLGHIKRHEHDLCFVWMVCRLNAGNLYTDWLLKVLQKILQLKNKACGAQGTELEALEEIF